MPLVLSEEQQLLESTASEFLAEKCPVSELRRLRDEQDADGFSRPLWREMVELGWAGVPFPDEVGGADMGYTELGILLQQTGRTLAATPLVSSVLAGGSALLLGGNDTQKKEGLAAICAGERLMALALQETPHFAPYQVSTRAEKSADGWTLAGEKRFVLDGHVADQLVVVARSAGSAGERDGLALFLVDARAAGVSIERTLTVDSRNTAVVRLAAVQVDASAALGAPGRGADILDPLLARCAAGLAAEMLGSLDEAFARTLQFLKDRKQFGVPIGSFQALKHRAARMYVEIELVRSVVLDALQAIDAGADNTELLVSVAKARCSDATQLVTNECVQMHGGIGVTDEEDIGFYMKRARVSELLFGDASFHRDRFASLKSF